MIRRLVEAHYFQNREQPTPVRIRFWLRELRTPEILVALAREYSDACRRLAHHRPLLAKALRGSLRPLEQALLAEENAERETDRRYWAPLRAELEQLRHKKSAPPQE